MPVTATKPHTNGAAKGASTEIATGEQSEITTASLSFTRKVERQFSAELGQSVQWTDTQKALAQHLFLKIDATFKALNAKRQPNDQITWTRINMQKLAIDAVHRVSLNLDALIPNHIHPIPYYNSKTEMFDLDLRIGYVGADYCRRNLAVEPPTSVTYRLVYESDIFKPIYTPGAESYEYHQASPFSPGKVIGGFGYIAYQDPSKNRLIIVTDRDFKRAKASAQTQDFWAEAKSEDEMKFKTVVHRVSSKIPLDPNKVNAVSFTAIQSADLDYIEGEVSDEAEQHANKETISLPVPTGEASRSVDESTGEVIDTKADTEPVQEGLAY